MNRLFLLLGILTCFLSTDTNAQTKTHRSKAGHAQTDQKGGHNKQTIVRDTVTKRSTTGTVPSSDASKKDTTVAEQVASDVHDSVKAQIKAPIVQVPVTLRSLIVPGVLFAYGAVTLNNGGLRKFNEEAHDFFWDGKPHSGPFTEDFLLLAPAAAVYGLNIAGIKGQNNLIDRSIIYGMSNAIANGFVFGLKYIGVEQRPDSTNQYSFPSGHTAEAFVSAEFLRQEYKGRIPWPVIASGYAVATGVAYLRMYHNKHWLSDVVAGAGVGIASTRFSYYLYPAIKHWLFGSKKVKETSMIMPTYNSGYYGFVFIRKFRLYRCAPGFDDDRNIKRLINAVYNCLDIVRNILVCAC